MTPGEKWKARKHTQSQLLSSVIEKRFQLGGICVHKSLIRTSSLGERGAKGGAVEPPVEQFDLYGREHETRERTQTLECDDA